MIVQRFGFFLGAVCLVGILGGCCRPLPSPGERMAMAQSLGRGGDLEPVLHVTPTFNLLGWQQLGPHSRGKPLHVYIEGDGLAWISFTRVSTNPTPLNPMGLRLALEDPAESRLYLARPCQYLMDDRCSKKAWTSHRFSPDVMAAYDKILDKIKAEFCPSSFVLFGYSGGGTVAALLAAQRNDVSLLVTVAGNLDVDAWVKKHGLTPLNGSLNPADFMDSLSRVPQYHFLGGRDSNITPDLFFDFEKGFKPRKNLHIRIVPQCDHGCGWVSRWRRLLNTIGEIH